MAQPNEDLHPWIRALSLGLWALSPALHGKQKSLTQKNKQYPDIPGSHMEGTSCLSLTHFSYLNFNDQYQGRYYSILVYFNS